ncbi:hypothetical protein J3E69DRAFT_349414 [Trichoderma sp. SZMC 28015]
MEQRQNLLLEDTNVPRMWPPLLCIASWITARMNTYMHSCEAPCQHGTVSMRVFGQRSSTGLHRHVCTRRRCVSTAGAKNTKEREAN